MKIAKELNYDLQLYQDRVGLVQYLDKVGMLDQCSPEELDKVTNYLLYSQDVTAQVVLKEGSKKKISYESLIETTLGENVVQRHKDTSIYRTVKPRIDRDTDADIPFMQELWKSIDIINDNYRYCKDVLDGKIDLDPEREIMPTYQNKFFMREWMIDLSKLQFAVRDVYRPVSCDKPIFMGLAPKRHVVGMRVGKNVLSDNPMQIDFGDWRVVYNLLKYYGRMKGIVADDPQNDWWEVYEFLEELVERIPWSPEHKHILVRKIDKVSNEQIVAELESMGGKKFSVNYISTIFKQHISKRIVKEAFLWYQEFLHRNDEEFWQVCEHCGKRMFLSEVNFSKKKTGEFKKVCVPCTMQLKVEKDERREKRRLRKIVGRQWE